MKTSFTKSPFFLLGFLGCAAASVACDRNAGRDSTNTTETTGAKAPTVEQVKDDPARFYGKRVTLTGEVDSVKSDAKSFRLEGNDWLFGDEIRVLTRSPVKMGGAPLSEDDKIQVTGTVRRFTVAEVERELGWDLTPEIEIDLRDKPVLVADEIRRVEPSATWSAKEPQGEIVSTVVFVTATNPDALAGQPIRLDKTKVQNVSGKGIWVGPSHADQTFVMPTGGADLSGIKAGDVVDVRGTVKKTPPVDQAIKNWNLAPTMRNILEGEPLYIEGSKIERASAGDAKKSSRGG